MSRRILVALIAGATLSGVAATAAAQSTDQLIQKYEKLAGSDANASTLVTSLRDGKDFTISGTSFDTPTKKLGNGEVNIALSLTEAKLAQQNITDPTLAQVKSALEPILQARADGRGWGAIANSMGFKLGDVMRSDKVPARNELARNERLEHASGRPETFERPEKPERPERPERSERPERPEHAGRVR